MEELIRQIEAVGKQVRALQQKVVILHAENQHLSKEVELLNDRLTVQSEAYEGLQEKYEVLRLAKNIDNEEHQIQLKQKIDVYLAEIDQCLKYFGD